MGCSPSKQRQNDYMSKIPYPNNMQNQFRHSRQIPATGKPTGQIFVVDYPSDSPSFDDRSLSISTSQYVSH